VAARDLSRPLRGRRLAPERRLGRGRAAARRRPDRLDPRLGRTRSPRGPSALFEANLFHPAPHALATTEHLLGLQALYLPLRLATGDPLAAHQAT